MVVTTYACRDIPLMKHQMKRLKGVNLSESAVALSM